MSRWFSEEIVAGGRLPLFCFLVGLIVGFLCIRGSVRLIRANVRWWFGNIRAGDVHVHHMVFGVVLCMVSAVGLIATFDTATRTTGALLSGLFGLGAALVLDEFALILYLRDVYWQEEGRASVDAVFGAVAVSGLLLLGFRPLEFLDVNAVRDLGSPLPWSFYALAMVDFGAALVVLLKGKVWTGLVGLFVWPLLIFGALRLARPGSPWARWRYGDRKMARALRRERRLRRPLIRAKIYVQDLTAGRPDVPHAKLEAERVLDRVVHAAPRPVPRAPISRRRRRSGTINRLPRARHVRSRAAQRPTSNNGAARRLPQQEYEPVEPRGTAHEGGSADGRQGPLLATTARTVFKQR
ncbi:hypothetical protein P0W64_17200 [Tsukamurella sp. 8F]|uniref:hypothetical protein n=1 Tax=unclassified Tsukamurella TaxID=2633480 RepID=UPI0023B94D57|nr:MULTISPECIES: hypothetical protein [unclassified Tsukamurella]MDF0531253.1 hypothetical protein [Tsukamurella sp. 8J]MDF0588522.1 hypothetical protein [Tsukamurella sp. 8F]